MTVPPDKARRRQLRDQYKRADQERRAAVLPIGREQLAALVDFVDGLVLSEGCDHTLRHARSWAEGHDLDWTPVAAGLAELGGYCDCEVVMNCDPEDVFG
ncbi:DUF2695 domain-containing protein [Amycolatopsis azurea]|uniref:DUF2695 domain-containing protein n=1 Tax=Amycolatopsis azurea DSM 43854 TaxID=1238180 RepID=A0ABX3JB13_9PSEU|nr:DUF2695 domain-containing protein [Amycolatopsis azurea]OOC04891.1 hypothetical protein B0293_20790 [Amycolatopsis azurea DSM 43854]